MLYCEVSVRSDQMCCVGEVSVRSDQMCCFGDVSVRSDQMCCIVKCLSYLIKCVVL